MIFVVNNFAMTTIEKILNFFKPKTTNQSSVLDAPQNKPEKQVKIIYVNRTINSLNIDAYRSGRQPMIGGDTCYGINDVIVYRYEIAPDLILGPDDVIRETAELLRLEEPKTIAHETKHLENAKYGNPLFTMKNYYEISGLYALDEVSAYATAYLGTGVPTFDEVCIAVSHGVDDLLNRKNWYIAQHMQQIQRRIVLACAGQNDDTIKQHLLGNLSPQYSKNFNSVGGAYLTFNGRGLYSSGCDVPEKLKQKLKLLRYEYENATRQTLQMMAQQMIEKGK